MKALDVKLAREMWQLKGQATAIALVLASGVATYIVSRSTLDSLQLTQSIYYADYRFSDVFATLKRAPDALGARIAAVPGVAAVETRVVAEATLDVAGFDDPVNGRLVSLPETAEPQLNALYLHAGRLPAPHRADEAVVSQPFAEAHGLETDDRIGAVINGRKELLRIVGIGSSPEYVYQIRPGDMLPDPVHYAVVWMRVGALGMAYDMDGAFNDVAVSVQRVTSIDALLSRLDRLLRPYGGARAYAREDQLSHRYLTQEMRGLESMAMVFPAIFLGVAAFLLNVVTARLISTQREVVGVLKAFGYGYVEIGRHYGLLIVTIAIVGSLLGLGAGAWLGHALTRLYVEFFHFPYLSFQLRPGAAATSMLLAGGAALAGGARALIGAMRLPPAEAMRPEPPTRYRRTILERLGARRWMDAPTRMIARHINRRPVQSLLTVIGIALSAAIMMLGSFQDDAIDYMMRIQFSDAAREDLTLSFTEPTARRALFELASWRGVTAAEPYRSVPVVLSLGHRSYRTGILGLEPGADLHRPVGADRQPAPLPHTGIVLTDYLADWLEAAPGDTLTVEFLTGTRRVNQIKLAHTVKEYAGVSGYMSAEALNRLKDEGPLISGVFMAVDARWENEIYRRLKNTPRVAGVGLRRQALESFERDMAKSILVFALVNTLLASTIAFGVIYNNARISFGERARELASLRVLGYRRSEVAAVLLGEFALLTLAGIPLGLVFGRELCRYLAASMASDIYRIPLVLNPSSYAFSSAVVLAAAVWSGWLVYRRIQRLDLIGVLKTRE